MCCPTRHVVQKYIVQERRLVKTDEGALEEPDQSLITTVWLWHQTVYNDDRKVIPLNPDHYTLKMLPDGKVNIRADCNLGGGFHRLNDGGISIEITYSTRAACPPESMDQIYVRDLNAAAKWFLKNDGLYVELKDGAGTMSFRRQ